MFNIGIGQLGYSFRNYEIFHDSTRYGLKDAIKKDYGNFSPFYPPGNSNFTELRNRPRRNKSQNAKSKSVLYPH